MFYWEYFKDRKDNKLNRIYGKELATRQEVIDYIEERIRKSDILQAELYCKKDGIYFKALDYDTKGVFKFFDRYLGKFETTKKLTSSFVGYAIKNME